MDNPKPNPPNTKAGSSTPSVREVSSGPTAVPSAGYGTSSTIAGSPFSQDLSNRGIISWRAVFAGAFISLLSFLILFSLGMAVGGSSLAGIIQGQSSGQGFGIGSGIWLILTVLISLFLGSYLASRVSGFVPRRVGSIQGLVIASLFFLFMLMQVGAIVGTLGQGLGSAVGAAGTAAPDILNNPQVKAGMNQLFSNLNLKSSPDVVARGVITRLIQGNDVAARNYLAQQAGISPAEADRRLNTVKANIQSTLASVGGTAAKVTSAIGWTLFGSMLLGAIFASLGGAAGVPRYSEDYLTEEDRKLIKDRRAA